MHFGSLDGASTLLLVGDSGGADAIPILSYSRHIMSSLNSFKGVIEGNIGSVMRVINGDTRSLHYSSYIPRLWSP